MSNFQDLFISEHFVLHKWLGMMAYYNEWKSCSVEQVASLYKQLSGYNEIVQMVTRVAETIPGWNNPSVTVDN